MTDTSEKFQAELNNMEVELAAAEANQGELVARIGDLENERKRLNEKLNNKPSYRRAVRREACKTSFVFLGFAVLMAGFTALIYILSSKLVWWTLGAAALGLAVFLLFPLIKSASGRCLKKAQAADMKKLSEIESQVGAARGELKSVEDKLGAFKERLKTITEILDKAPQKDGLKPKLKRLKERASNSLREIVDAFRSDVVEIKNVFAK